MSRIARCVLVLATVAAAAMALAVWATAATPPSGTLTPDSSGKGSIAWTGNATVGTDAAGDSGGWLDADGHSDATSGCVFFNLDVPVPDGFYNGFLGGVQVTVDG